MTDTSTPPTAAPPATGGLSIRGVRKVFGDQEAIKSLDLEVRPGEFLSLLGPSGCGKTTLLRMIAGFEDPTSGSIELGGRDIVGLPPYKRPVNTVFQSYALFPHMTVADNIAYGLKRAKMPRAKIGTQVAEALAMVRMTDFAQRRPDQLSGGQQQRIALARALVNRPEVLLLDEPMSALDRKLREEMQLELTRLHHELGMTFVFVTHDQEEALAMSDRIVVMYEGVVQQIGSATDIYSRPANAFVAGFIGKQNFQLAAYLGTDGDTADLQADEARFTLPKSRLEGFAPGDTVQLAIRPEIMRVTRLADVGSGSVAEAPEVNTTTGRVIAVSFLGDVVQYVVKPAAGEQVLARVAAKNAAPIASGDEVRLSWDPSDVQVFAS